MKSRFRKIRYFVRILQRKMHHRELRNSTLNAFPYWLAAVMTGLIAVGYAKVFGIAEKWITELYSGHAELAFIGAPLAFLIGWWLVRKFAPAAGGSGIPQLLAAAELSGRTDHNSDAIRDLMGLRVFVVKILSSIVCVEFAGTSALPSLLGRSIYSSGPAVTGSTAPMSASRWSL